MVFYAYLNPAVITQACETQPFGYQCLIAMLRGFVQNCCLIDRNGEVSAALAGRVRHLPANSDRKTIEAILKFLSQHNRFIDGAEEVDVIVNESEAASASGAMAETCSLASYQFTNFEHDRCFSAHGGVTLGFGKMTAAQMLDTCLGRALRGARRVQICDGSLGRNCDHNYRHTVEKFLSWFRQINLHGTQCPVEIHCREPAENDPKRSERRALLREIRALGVEMTFYKFLPHDRFILTDQFALEIGRGMDFLEPTRDCNRDASIATKDLRQVAKLLDGYARHRLPGV